MRKSLPARAARAALTLTLLLVAIAASAYDYQQDNLSYNILDPVAGTVEVAECAKSATTVNIPANVAFDGKNWMVTSIGREAFINCSSLTSIALPDAVTSIGDEAFLWCESLTSITIPDAVTSIGVGAFAGCSSLTSITIPDAVTSIGASTFQDCSSLASITIPDAVTSIGDGAFAYSGLKSATIGSNVSEIGDQAFGDCYALATITCRAAVPPVCANSVFDDVDKQQCKLFVPEGSIDAYKAADQWKNFFNIEEFNGIGKVWIDGAMGREYFDLGGRKALRPQRGKVAIERRSDGKTRKVVVRE